MSFIASRCDSELPMPSLELPIKVEVTGIACMLEHMATSRLAKEGCADPTQMRYESFIARICPQTRTSWITSWK